MFVYIKKLNSTKMKDKARVCQIKTRMNTWTLTI